VAQAAVPSTVNRPYRCHRIPPAELTRLVVIGHGYFSGWNSLRAVRFDSSWAKALPWPPVP